MRLTEGHALPAPASIARRVLGVSLFETGQTIRRREALERALSLYDPTEHDSAEAPIRPGPAGGRPQLSGAHPVRSSVTPTRLGPAAEAAVSCRQLNHANTLGYTLSFGLLHCPGAWAMSQGVASAAEH